MRLALLALAAAAALGAAAAMSTCKTLDLEMVKKKRIEAIRSQILSKLRLPKEPEEEQEEQQEEIPSTLLSLYNSTREMLKEQQEQEEEQTSISSQQEEEEYFAKVLHKFNMTEIAIEKNDTRRTSRNLPMVFDVASVRRSVGDYRLLTRAELRLYVRNTNLQHQQRVELYHGLGGSAHYLASRFITNKHRDKWVSFDVTDTLQTWLREDKGDEQGFQLRLFCECGQSGPDPGFGFSVSGLENPDRSDKAELSKQHKKSPYILTMSIPQNGSAHFTSRRRRSAADAKDTCTTQTESCCVRSLYIDFRKDLGWKWIHKPSGYNANYCMGSCTYIWNAENKYSQILALYKHHNPGASAQPCCVPQTLEPLPILYYVGRQHKVEQLSNMIVKSCKCS